MFPPTTITSVLVAPPFEAGATWADESCGVDTRAFFA
jgi:hypothetical protein